MALSVAQIIQQTAFWLDDPKKSKFDDSYLDQLFKIAYPAVVAVVETAGKLWNMAADRILIEVVPTQREYPVVKADPQYAIGPSGRVRKVVTVHRVEGVTAATAVTANLGRTLMHIRPTGEAQVSAPWPQVGRQAFGEWLYLYRSSAGTWMLGLEARTPVPQVLEVAYVPAIKDFWSLDEYPTMVPGDFHYLIALRAAMMAKGVTNRLNDAIVAEYAAGEQNMLNELNSLRAHVSQRV